MCRTKKSHGEADSNPTLHKAQRWAWTCPSETFINEAIEENVCFFWHSTAVQGMDVKQAAAGKHGYRCKTTYLKNIDITASPPHCWSGAGQSSSDKVRLQLPVCHLCFWYGGCNWCQSLCFGSAAMWDRPPAAPHTGAAGSIAAAAADEELKNLTTHRKVSTVWRLNRTSGVEFCTWITWFS